MTEYNWEGSIIYRWLKIANNFLFIFREKKKMFFVDIKVCKEKKNPEVYLLSFDCTPRGFIG